MNTDTLVSAVRTPLEQAHDVLRSIHARRLFIVGGPNRQSEFEGWWTPRGLLVLQAWRDGGVDAYGSIISSNALDPFLAALRRFGEPADDTPDLVAALTTATAALGDARTALTEIIARAPTGQRPDEEDYDDMETASSKGYDAGQYDAAHGAANLAGAIVSFVIAAHDDAKSALRDLVTKE